MKNTAITILGLLVAVTTQVQAGTIVLDAVDRGWYANDGGTSFGATSYFVGNSQLQVITRNWFVFDLTGIDQPIVSAELQLGNLGGVVYVSPDPTETYTLFDVSTSPSLLMNGLGGIPAFNDLGSGAIHGSYIASPADNTASPIIISLNAAALGSMNAASGFWATGGAITTLDNDPTTRENLFGGTQLLPLSATRLVISTIPAPAALPLLLAPVLFGTRNRKRSGG